MVFVEESGPSWGSTRGTPEDEDSARARDKSRDNIDGEQGDTRAGARGNQSGFHENDDIPDANGVDDDADAGDESSDDKERPGIKPAGADERILKALKDSKAAGRDEIETFLDCPPCPFRRTSFGSTHCAISTDPYVNEVDPLTCFNCDVPKIISVPRCRFLTVGTGIRSYRGEGRLVVQMACKELNIRLYNLDTCARCPLMSETESLAAEMISERARADVSLPVNEELIEHIAADIKLDLLRREARSIDEFKPSQFLRCWRFEEGYCRKFPEYTRGKVTCVLPASDRNNELYDKAILPALKELNLVAYRFKYPLSEVDFLCQICENQQESDFVIYNLEEWSSASLMLIGMAYGLGKLPVLLLRKGFPKPPLLETLEHNVLEYQSFSHLFFRLKAFFAPHTHGLADEHAGGEDGDDE